MAAELPGLVNEELKFIYRKQKLLTYPLHALRRLLCNSLIQPNNGDAFLLGTLVNPIKRGGGGGGGSQRPGRPNSELPFRHFLPYDAVNFESKTTNLDIKTHFFKVKSVFRGPGKYPNFMTHSPLQREIL